MFMFFHALVFMMTGIFGGYDGGPGYSQSAGFVSAQSLVPDDGGGGTPSDGGGTMPGQGGGR